MLNNDLEIYDSCDLEKPNIPSRSRLYYLNPIGLDTPYIESLTSYIARLAEAHCLSSNSLITQLEGVTRIRKNLPNQGFRN